MFSSIDIQGLRQASSASASTSSASTDPTSWLQQPLGTSSSTHLPGGSPGSAPATPKALPHGRKPLSSADAPSSNSVYALHYKPGISSKQLTFRIHKRATLSSLDSLLAIRAYWESLDGIAVAAVLSQILVLKKYDKQYKPTVAASLVTRLQTPLAASLIWNDIQTTSSILWSLSRLQHVGGPTLPANSALLARVLARVTASTIKLNLVPPRRLAIIAFSASKVLPSNLKPTTLTYLTRADLLPPPKVSLPAEPKDTTTSPKSTGKARNPPPDLARSTRITLARVAAAALHRLPQADTPAHIAAWEACHFSPQGLANLSLAFARTNYLPQELLNRVARSVVSMVESPAAPQLDLQDCVGLAQAFAHVWPLQPHPEVFSALAKAFPAAILARQRRAFATRAAAVGTGPSNGLAPVAKEIMPTRTASEFRAAFASIATAATADSGASLRLQDCAELATAFSALWPLQKHAEVFEAIASAIKDKLAVQQTKAAGGVVLTAEAAAGVQKRRQAQMLQLGPQLRTAFAAVGIPTTF